MCLCWPIEYAVSHSPSGDTSGNHNCNEPSVTATGLPTVPCVGLKEMLRRFLMSVCAEYASCPVREKLRYETEVAAPIEVTASGAPMTTPVSSSISTRQIFELPPRLLEKYRYFPSGDQTGLRSVEEPSVTATGSPPEAGMVQMCSRCPYLSRSEERRVGKDGGY